MKFIKNKNLIKIKLLFLIVLFSSISIAQNKTSWEEVDKLKFDLTEKTRRSTLPTEYKLYKFDYNSFVQKLINVPQRDTFRGVSDVIVSLPNPNGDLVAYRILEASTFEPALQERFSEIRSFVGQGVKGRCRYCSF